MLKYYLQFGLYFVWLHHIPAFHDSTQQLRYRNDNAEISCVGRLIKEENTLEKLCTATGKEFDCDYFNPFPEGGMLNLSVWNTTIAEAGTVFSDPAETIQLYFEGQYAAHYTRLIAIQPTNGGYRVVLGKE